jgi:hypothetical protein
MTRAQRLKRVIGIDLETCPACGGAIRIIACVEDPDTIEQILTHLNAKGAEPGVPSRRRAGRGPSRNCSADSGHLINTTLVCDASGAATVAVGPVVGEWRKTCP